MFDHLRQSEAKALCHRCPVAEVCLWAALAGEAGEEYRYGVAGGLRPGERRAVAEALTAAAIGARLDQALAIWRATGKAPQKLVDDPAPLAYRDPKVCPGCGTTFVQARAGRRRRWCSSQCAERTRWANMTPEARAAASVRRRARKARAA